MGTRNLPTGTVTFLFTDVEGSTKLLHALGPDAYADALAAHRVALRAAFTAHGGVEVDTQGDAFFVAFPTAPGALAAARQATDALTDGPLRVRIGLHTGTPVLTDEGYVGADVHKGARIAAAGHGGQVLVSTATAALLDEELKDLGLHRLKDLNAAERIFQADAGEHPPLKTLHHTNLPVPATPFLGRQADLAELATVLAREDVRLITLTGTGGTGKTRLALQAAADAADHFPDGVWWVPLAALRDPGMVLESAARVLGVTGELAEHVGDRRLLLLLDNFEHLVSAAAELSPLLSACPNLRLLVTSREPLHLAGEHEYVVDPLTRADAVELFLTRALAAKRDFSANGEVELICARLDHLPLAIELAAARVKVLSPVALLERLEQRLPLLAGGQRDAPERQRTLRATIEWSHELLNPDEQGLFARLAVFRGGWTLEAAEAVAEGDLDTLQSLVDKSLVRVRPESGRFWMLETIREFAVERLEASGEADEMRRRHAAHFLALAREAEPHVLRDSMEWVDRLELDHDNLRAALDRLAATGGEHPAAELTGLLWRFWYLKSHLAEGRRRLEATLSSPGASDEDRARALHGASVMAMSLGDARAARRHAQEALALEERLGHAWGVAYARMMIGSSFAEAGDDTRDFGAAARWLDESAKEFDLAGDAGYALIARHNRAWIASELGDREGARQMHEANLETARALGHNGIMPEAISQLGLIARDDGRLHDAATLLREAIRLEHQRGMTLNLATQIGRLASIVVRQGDAARAATLVGASEALTEAHGGQVPWWARERNAETLALVRDASSDRAADEAVSAGRALALEDAVAIALDDSGAHDPVGPVGPA